MPFGVPLEHDILRGGRRRRAKAPYLIAADVYAMAAHTGCGGWTWYTGSAGWMYRLLLESLLGLEIRGDQLTVTPCVPDDWHAYRIDYRHGQTPCRIQIGFMAPATACTHVTADGVPLAGTEVTLVDDRQTHMIEIVAHRVAPATSGTPA